MTNESKYNIIVNQAKELLSKNELFSLRRFCKELDVSEKMFSRMFVKIEGMKFSQYRIQEKMKFAKELLKDERVSVILVSKKLGYKNSESFMRVFKKSEGITPSEYRVKFLGSSYKHTFQDEKYKELIEIQLIIDEAKKQYLNKTFKRDFDFVKQYLDKKQIDRLKVLCERRKIQDLNSMKVIND